MDKMKMAVLSRTMGIPSGPSLDINNSSMCQCFDRVYEMIAGAMGSMSPEERRRRDFERNGLVLLKDGAVFVLVDAAVETQEGGGFMNNMSRSVTSFLGGTNSVDSRAVGKHPASGLPVMVGLEDDDGLKVSWKTLELEQNKPKFSGAISFQKIQVVDKMDQNGKLLLRLLDRHGKTQLSLIVEDQEVRNQWASAFSEAIVVLAPDVSEEVSENASMLQRQRRYMELESRRKEREQKKRDLGNVGMKYTAQAMTQR